MKTGVQGSSILICFFGLKDCWVAIMVGRVRGMQVQSSMGEGGMERFQLYSGVLGCIEGKMGVDFSPVWFFALLSPFLIGFLFEKSRLLPIPERVHSPLVPK